MYCRRTYCFELRRVLLVGLCLAMGAFVALPATAQDAAEAEEDNSLSLEQQSLAARFERLESVASKLAELAAASEPERAAQLREAIRASREMGTRERFATIVDLLRQEQLTAASRDQDELHQQLQKLLQVLLEDPTNDDRDKLKEKLRNQIREINRMIRQQRSLRSQNQNGRDADDVADAQKELENAAAELENELNEDASQPAENQPGESDPGESQPSESEPGESQPSESQPSESLPSESQPGESQPGQPQSGDSQPQDQQEQSEAPPNDAAQRIAAARQAMQEAEQKLREAERDKAADKQREAQRELEQARAELERILRQLREEEMEQMLTQLAARFREMLSLQRSIHEETVVVDTEAKQSDDRAVTLKAVRLSRREADLVKLADRALLLLREDGTSVAFTEALEQIREDMDMVVTRLAEPDTGELTQLIEVDIITALEESVAALDMALDELAQQRSQSGQQQQGGPPGEQALVSKLSELRMIRTLQGRINSRTKALDRIMDQGDIDQANLRGQLNELAERQQRVYEATRDLDTGRNN